MSILKELRKEAKITVRELSSYTGVNISTLSRLENGLNNYTIDNLNALTAFFNVDTDLLLGRDGHYITNIGKIDSRTYTHSNAKVEIVDNAVIRTINAKPKANEKAKKLIELIKTLDDDTIDLLTRIILKIK